MTSTKAIDVLMALQRSNKDDRNIDAALYAAIGALARQVQQNPVVTFIPDMFGKYRYDLAPAYTVVQCPRCKSRLRLSKKHDHFCWSCGQALNWSNVKKAELVRTERPAEPLGEMKKRNPQPDYSRNGRKEQHEF